VELLMLLQIETQNVVVRNSVINNNQSKGENLCQ
jgi:hypothetical protein